MRDHLPPAGPERERCLERVERALYDDLYAALPADVARAAGIVWRAEGEERLARAAGVPHPFFNRVMGIGLDRAPDDAWLERRIAFFGEAGAVRYLLQVLPHVGTDALAALLRARGLVPLRGWAKHVARLDATPAAAPASAVRIERAGAADAEVWAALCGEGFSMPAPLHPWLAATVGRPGWRHHLAFLDDEPVATGALFLHDGVATLSFAATRPDARGRGAQSALIRARLEDAAAAGARWAVSETDEEGPDRPNPSLHNVVRLGLPVAYVRANWGPPPPA